MKDTERHKIWQPVEPDLGFITYEEYQNQLNGRTARGNNDPRADFNDLPKTALGLNDGQAFTDEALAALDRMPAGTNIPLNQHRKVDAQGEVVTLDSNRGDTERYGNDYEQTGSKPLLNK